MARGLTIVEIPFSVVTLDELARAIAEGRCAVLDLHQVGAIHTRRVFLSDRDRATLDAATKGGARADAMLRMRTEGSRYHEIGAAFGVSTNRARQIVVTHAGRRGIKLDCRGGVMETEQHV